MREKRLHLTRAALARMSEPTEMNEAPRPVHIRDLRANAVVPAPNHAAQLIEQTRTRSRVVLTRLLERVGRGSRHRNSLIRWAREADTVNLYSLADAL